MKRLFQIKVSLYYVYRIPKRVKVKAYKRLRQGKIEKVARTIAALGDVDDQAPSFFEIAILSDLRLGERLGAPFFYDY